MAAGPGKRVHEHGPQADRPPPDLRRYGGCSAGRPYSQGPGKMRVIETGEDVFVAAPSLRV